MEISKVIQYSKPLWVNSLIICLFSTSFCGTPVIKLKPINNAKYKIANTHARFTEYLGLKNFKILSQLRMRII